jgi:signal transduction histidine kinase
VTAVARTPTQPLSRITRPLGLLAPLPLGDTERGRLAANLRAGLVAGAAGAAVAGVANGILGLMRSAAVLLALSAACLGALHLVRRGRTTAAAVVGLFSIIVAIDLLLVLNDGIHDRAVLLLPVVIVFAAFTLDRRLFVATTGAAVVSAAIVIRLEQAGWISTRFGMQVRWLDYVDTTIILVVTAVAVHMLLGDLGRGLTALKESEGRLAAANRELNARNAELERFTYVVSHDLKSPLVTIRGFLGYVERDAREGDLGHLEGDVGRIRAAADRMGQLLDDLLELSRTGRVVRPMVDVPLSDVVREARTLAAGRLLARGVSVVVEEPLPLVRGDRSQLVALLQNLLDNAARFMGEEPNPGVWISSRTEGAGDGEAIVAVRDNGMGIDPVHHERVFDLFHRLDPSSGGTGLGLALARRIVQAHGGRIWIESEGGGRGSTFCFALPRGDGAA